MNKKTGQPLGEGSSPLTGESIVTVDNGTLAIDNTFDSVKVEAMYTDKPPDYKNEVRLAYNGEFTTTYQRDLFILHFKTFDVSPFVSAILNLGANPLEVGKYSLDNVAIGAAVKF
jgi:hypothetical protein